MKQSKISNFSPSREHLLNGLVYSDYQWRKLILERDCKKCRNCFNLVQDIHRYRVPRLEVHHIIPRHHGGENTLANGVTLCTFCHDYFDYACFRKDWNFYDIIQRLDFDERIKKVRKFMRRQYMRYLRNIILNSSNTKNMR